MSVLLCALLRLNEGEKWKVRAGHPWTTSTVEFGMKFVGVDNAAVTLLGFGHNTELLTSPKASVIFT